MENNEQDEILKEVIKQLATFPVSDWLNISSICKENQDMFPNAKKAAEIKNSKLYKALK